MLKEKPIPFSSHECVNKISLQNFVTTKSSLCNMEIKTLASLLWSDVLERLLLLELTFEERFYLSSNV